VVLFHFPDCESDRRIDTNGYFAEVVTSVRNAGVRSHVHLVGKAVGRFLDMPSGKAADIVDHHSTRSANTVDLGIRFVQHKDLGKELELPERIHRCAHDLDLHGLP
jgi:hypothetical protein